MKYKPLNAIPPLTPTLSSLKARRRSQATSAPLKTPGSSTTPVA